VITGERWLTMLRAAPMPSPLRRRGFGGQNPLRGPVVALQGSLHRAHRWVSMLAYLRGHCYRLVHVALGVNLGYVGLGVAEEDLGGLQAEILPDASGVRVT